MKQQITGEEPRMKSEGFFEEAAFKWPIDCTTIRTSGINQSSQTGGRAARDPIETSKRPTTQSRRRRNADLSIAGRQIFHGHQVPANSLIRTARLLISY